MQTPFEVLGGTVGADAFINVPPKVVLAAENIVAIWARELQFTLHGHASLLNGITGGMTWVI